MSRFRSGFTFLALCGLLYLLFWFALPTGAYYVSVGNRPFGVIASPEALKKEIKAYIDDYSRLLSWKTGGGLKEDLSFEHVFIDRNMLMSSHDLAAAMFPYLTVWQNAAVIYADGQQIGCAVTPEEAQNVLVSILSPVSHLTPDFAEQIEVRVELAPPEKVKSGDELLDYLLFAGNSYAYTVAQDDTISSLVERTGLTAAQLYNLNPILNAKPLSAGMELRIGTPADKLHVLCRFEVSRQIEVKPTYNITHDSTRYETQNEVISMGVPGKAFARMLITTVDGVEIAGEVLSEQLIIAPINGVMSVGSRKVESANLDWSEEAMRSFTTAVQPGDESEAKRVQSALSTRIGTAWLMWPVAEAGRISSNFGPRDGRLHLGLDIACETGTPVYAAHSGVVAFSGERGNYGKLVIIDHGFGITTRYAHMNDILVTMGDSLLRGDPVGLVGSTGRSTGPHLHFEVREDNVASDPLYVLGPPPQE